MIIHEAIEFLENDLNIDSDRCSMKQYSEQVDKVREIILFLKDLDTELNGLAYDQEHGG